MFGSLLPPAHSHSPNKNLKEDYFKKDMSDFSCSCRMCTKETTPSSLQQTVIDEAPIMCQALS
jgi:hypothetical protein